MDKNTKKGGNIRRKKILLTAIIIIVILLAVMAVLSEAVLPAISQKLDENAMQQNIQTHIFHNEASITEEMLEEYDTLVKDIYYKTNGVEVLVTDGRFYETGGNAAVMFSKYIDAIKNGDSKAYAECFSDKYDSGKGLDRFASGNYEFPPQRLYDIHIEQLDEYYDDTTGFILGLFSVSYRIYHNTGDFRSDMTDNTAPLIITTEEFNGTVKITDVAYRYGN